MKTEDFRFDLPESSIAHYPSASREASKLMVINRKTGEVTHTRFSEIGEFLPKNSVLIRNNVSVLKARIFGKRETGGKAEMLLLKPGVEVDSWYCLLKPSKKLPVGSVINIQDKLTAKVLEKQEAGEALVVFTSQTALSVDASIEKLGEIPLPGYIERASGTEAIDEQRYQTVFADPSKRLAAAAPTAGLHFTDGLIKDLEQQGHDFTDLTLNIGLGTFKPIKTENITDHQIHTETYTINPETERFILDKTRPRIAVGTTSLRAIEHYTSLKNQSLPTSGAQDANIFIYPPYEFKYLDGLITNFHLPASTLICLVSAFLAPGDLSGIEWVKELYQEAIDNKYRFFSYGDSMLMV